METIITIDSNMRNKTLYPNNSNFSYSCKNNYLNPKSLKLLGAVIGNTQYIINSNNNQFNFTYLGTSYTATITNSNYNPTSLGTQLQTQLNALAIAGNTFTVTVDQNLNKFTIVSTALNIYKFSLNTQLATLLGFNNTDSSAVTTITSPNMYNVSTTRYYKLVVKELYSSYDTNITGLFNFLILNNSNSGSFTYLTDGNNVNNVLNIESKINLQTMTIQLFDEWNNFVQLNNIEFILIFKIIN